MITCDKIQWNMFFKVFAICYRSSGQILFKHNKSCKKDDWPRPSFEGHTG